MNFWWHTHFWEQLFSSCIETLIFCWYSFQVEWHRCLFRPAHTARPASRLIVQSYLFSLASSKTIFSRLCLVNHTARRSLWGSPYHQKQEKLKVAAGQVHWSTWSKKLTGCSRDQHHSGFATSRLLSLQYLFFSKQWSVQETFENEELNLRRNSSSALLCSVRPSVVWQVQGCVESFAVSSVLLLSGFWARFLSVLIVFDSNGYSEKKWYRR